MSSREVTNGSGGVVSEDGLEATIVTDPLPREPPSIPATVGRYEVDECIGEGGMGLVLRARDPRLDRVVAIKLLHADAAAKASGDTTRLLREAQALAKLSHPNVIDVFDVGVVDGRVFIAMEYVAGLTLGAWLRDTSPSRAEIIDAFIQAGQGLAAAHEAGLVHRDFKPANVLRGHDGRVRVVDFGLAAPPREHEVKTTLGSLDGNPIDVRMTATGFVVGTPAYMAPEAHCGELVDARSDQFSFCIALFEALWGQRPFPAKTAKEVASQSVNGQIHFPPGVDVPASLREVVLRGLRPAPDDRWPSMEALLDSLQPRTRARWPWLALGGGVVAVTAGALLLLGPDGTTSCEAQADAIAQIWGQGAPQRVHDAFTRSGLSYAEESWTRVHEHLDDHTEALAAARHDACEARAKDPSSTELLDRRTLCLDRRTAELRGVVAVLESADASTVRNAVRITGGLHSLQTCDDEALAAAVAPPPPAIADDVAQAHDDLAQVRATLHAGHYDRARPLAESLIERIESLGYAPLLAEARYVLGQILEGDGHYEAAHEQTREALMIAQGAGHDALVAKAATQLIFSAGNRLREPEEAQRWVRHARAAVGRLADPRDASRFFQSTLGNYHWSRGELEDARTTFEQALRTTEEQLGPRHPMTLIVRSNLAMVHHEMGDNTKARALVEHILADRIEVYGPSHPMVASTYGNLGVIEQLMGDLDAAVEHTQEALDLLEASVGKEHPLYPQMLMNLSNNYYFKGDVPEAIRRQEQAKDLIAQTLGSRDHLVGRSMSNLGAFYHEVERNEDARTTLIESRSILEEHLPPEHPEIAGVIGNLANVDRATGRLTEALAGYTEAIEMTEKSLGSEHPDIAYSLLGRGAAYLELERFDDALTDLRRAVALVVEAEAEVGSERVASTRYELAEGLWSAGQHAEARDQMQQAQALLDRSAKDPDDLPAKINTWLREHPQP